MFVSFLTIIYISTTIICVYMFFLLTLIVCVVIKDRWKRTHVVEVVQRGGGTGPPYGVRNIDDGIAGAS